MYFSYINNLSVIKLSVIIISNIFLFVNSFSEISSKLLYPAAYRIDGKYVPCLATEWSSSGDGLTYTFKLREGVKFNDGSDFNAAAAKLYFDNMRPTLGMSANYGQITLMLRLWN